MTRGYGDWAVEVEEAEECCNNQCNQGRDCPKREGYFVADYAADLFVRAVMTAGVGVLALILIGVWI